MSSFYYNNKIYQDGTAAISPDNHSFRYGDGLFETMKVMNGGIQLAGYHFERLFEGLNILQFDLPKTFTPAWLSKKILEIAVNNHHDACGRVRLTIARGNGGLYDLENQHPNVLIQTWPLDPSMGELNSNGLVLDFFRDAVKTCDAYSHLKSNNFLPYVMAALHAKKEKLNDCILLNSHGRICDTTIANVFMVKDDIISTPSLTEGCIAGVMRRHVISILRNNGKTVLEKSITPEELCQADSVFLTNSIRPVRWVKSVGSNQFLPGAAPSIYSLLLQTF